MFKKRKPYEIEGLTEGYFGIEREKSLLSARLRAEEFYWKTGGETFIVWKVSPNRDSDPIVPSIGDDLELYQAIFGFEWGTHTPALFCIQRVE